MQTWTHVDSEATFNPAPRVAQFLFVLDRVTEAIGANVPSIVDLAYLRSLPANTLGRAWADALDSQNLDPFSTGARLKQIHDGVHVITGYDTSPIGEAQVQLFLLGSKFRPRHGLLFLGLVVPIAKYLGHYQQLDRLYEVVSELLQAFRRGRQSAFDIQQWHPELAWETPLRQVQKQFNII
ncbi:Coq4 family protein [Altericista sp. CCNU0014]|uniref:Coq4 family protein n=1 Tax=Altericista sp. CCNU0014 TaxID=3082949 RepID=UPI0038510266